MHRRPNVFMCQVAHTMTCDILRANTDSNFYLLRNAWNIFFLGKRFTREQSRANCKMAGLSGAGTDEIHLIDEDFQEGNCIMAHWILAMNSKSLSDNLISRSAESLICR